MERKKKIDLHLVLKYGRPLICFVLVVSFIFIYSLSVLADGTLSDYVDFNARYGIEQGTTTSNLTLYNGSMTAIYTADGHNSSNLSFTGFYNTSTQYSTVMGSYLLGSSNWATKWTRSNISYDFTNAYTMIGYNSSVTSSGATVVQVLGSGNICLIDRTIVSDAPFSIFIFFINQSNGTWGTYDASGIFSASSASANGYYCLDMYGGSSYPQTLKRMGNVAFTDLNIYLPSSDGASGFTNFSTSSTDFSFEDENYNFNYLKTDNYISSPNDPEPLPDSPVMGQFYNYAGVNGYFQGLNNNGVLWITNFSFNEYMRLHPEEYKVKIHYTGNIDKADTNINVPVTYDYSEYIPLTYVVGNGSSYRLTREVLFSNFTAVSDPSVTLADGFESITTQATGITSQNYTTFNFWTFEGTQYSNNPSFGLNRSLTNIVRQVYINAEVSVIWDPENDGQNETISGVYRKRIGLLDGSEQVMENTISNNYNPPETSDPQYPGTLTDSQGNIVVGSGGTNISVNPTTFANFNAIVEYLYHIDANEFLALAGNNQNAIQYALNTLSSTESNGFFPVLKRTFDIIPDQIWNWIKVSFAVILGGAILGISYRMVRWR